MRIHDEHVHLIQPAEGLNRRRAGVAGRCADNGGALPARFERMVHHPGEQLHRHVLESERGAVEQLQHEKIVADLRQRRDGGMAEAAVGFLQHLAEGARLDLVAHKLADHLFGDLRIGLARKTRDLVTAQLRIGFRHIKPAVARKARQQRVGEGEYGRLPASGDVTHGIDLLNGRAEI